MDLAHPYSEAINWSRTKAVVEVQANSNRWNAWRPQKRRLERIVSSICATHRATCEVTFLYGHPTLVNNHEMCELVRSVVMQDLSCQQDIVSFTSLAGEDFSEFAARVPGAFYLIGVGNPEKETQYPHHHPRFNIDEDALKVGVVLHVRAALRYLNM